MGRIWQWAWNRYATRYLSLFGAISLPLLLFNHLTLSFLVVAFEESGHYVEAAAVTAVAVLVFGNLIVLPGRRLFRRVERWAAGHEVDRASALEATYTWARGHVARAVVGNAVLGALVLVLVGAIAGASASRLFQYGMLGAAAGTAQQLVVVHGYTEAVLRPARVAIAGDTGIGDSLPRSRPTFAAWT